MIKTINVSGLNSEQIQQIQTIIEAFKAKNELDKLSGYQYNKSRDIIDDLTDHPIQVDGFLSREEIYDR
ncbi:hypothetical protein [Roseofilum capinflatum]|uniref:Uncharacterized protein n=1 Tax=Roseofilum capinflatum BLCC-M114 TaxID=3022440 RepID=A0ABT7BCI1_9CYAN|nr:hypothetical protein [Roseofilum capinflatum]MDJ1176866.1 hypothetical protein [Roseofilum capinflatum BLCC-M114]